MDKYQYTAERARETFDAIKELRKTMPQKYAWQREELEKKVKELQDKWWQEIKPIMKNNP